LHARCAESCVAGRNIWDDTGSGANSDVTIWGHAASVTGIAPHTMISQPGRGLGTNADKSLFWCIKKACIAPPLVLTDELKVEASSYFTQQPETFSIDSSGSILSLSSMVMLAILALLFK
jgi:hypothetical protein